MVYLYFLWLTLWIYGGEGDFLVFYFYYEKKTFHEPQIRLISYTPQPLVISF